MALDPVAARVLACLIEKETTVPDSYPLTANALRSACNQSSNRNPVTSYDDRMIDDALVALKSIGLVRFVHPSHGGRTLRYRHVADERWDLGRGELGVLAMLILRGPETEATLRSRAEKHLAEGGVSAEAALDELMARRPDPFVERLERRSGEREPRFVQRLGDVAESDGDAQGGGALMAMDVEREEFTSSSDVPQMPPPAPSSPTSPEVDADASTDDTSTDDTNSDLVELVDSLMDEVTDLRRRVERLERLYDG